jgi:predicted RNA-binding protein with PIN domain
LRAAACDHKPAMPDSYLIDGYNLIHALGFLDRRVGTTALQESRRRLLAFLHQAFLEEADRVTIIFDAGRAPARVSPWQTYHGLQVRFALDHQSADDLIESLIEEASVPRSLVVISNDTRLQQAAHRRGCRAWTHDLFLDFIEGRRAAARPTLAGDELGRQPESMSPQEAQEWQREFAGLEEDPELKEFFEMDRFEDEGGLK